MEGSHARWLSVPNPELKLRDGAPGPSREAQARGPADHTFKLSKTRKLPARLAGWKSSRGPPAAPGAPSHKRSVGWGTDGIRKPRNTTSHSTPVRPRASQRNGRLGDNCKTTPGCAAVAATLRLWTCNAFSRGEGALRHQHATRHSHTPSLRYTRLLHLDLADAARSRPRSNS